MLTSQETRYDDPLPQPLRGGIMWPRRQREASEALWRWHASLLAAAGADSEPKDAFFDEEAKRIEDGEPVEILPEAVTRPAYDACDEHDLSLEHLAAQVRGIRYLRPPVRFRDEEARRRMVDQWVVPHGRLLAHLGGVRLRLQQPMVDMLSLGFFYTGRLVVLPDDLAHDRLFLPLDTLDQYDVTVDQLRAGRVDEGVRRMLWRESVRARDNLARGRGVMDDLPWRLRHGLKRWWLGALELLNEIEARDYDVWNQPPHLSRLHRAQVELQALFGKATSRH